MGGVARFSTVLALALLIVAGATLVFWPGVAMYDSVAQYGQVVAGQYDDWHPPVMARLWSVLHGLCGDGTAPMFLLQLGLYGLGFGLIAATLAATGRAWAASATLILSASPLLLGWQAVVLKDAQMLGALLAATGLIAAFRLREKAIPGWTSVAAAVLILYAPLVRANAPFATVPLVILLAPRPHALSARLAAIAVATLLVLGVAPAINHRLFAAETTDVAKSEPLFDLAGIAMRTPSAPSPFTGAERAVIAARHCSKPFFWDPLGDERACGGVVARLQEAPVRSLYHALGSAIVAHPAAYLAHRAAHWNSTERWLVPAGLPSAAPGETSEPNDLGLVSPSSPLAGEFDKLARAEAATPCGWPILWTVVAGIAAAVAAKSRDVSSGGLAFALAGSALATEASFFVVSIASDLRYHLWSMTASALALILAAGGAGARRGLLIPATALLGMVVAGGLAARATLPRSPASYRAMIMS